MKNLCTVVILGILSMSHLALASERSSCVVQVLKNDTYGQAANFIFVCDGEVITSHTTASQNKLSAQEVKDLNAGYLTTVKSLVAGESNCQEFDSELFWIALCSKQ